MTIKFAKLDMIWHGLNISQPNVVVEESLKETSGGLNGFITKSLFVKPSYNVCRLAISRSGLISK